MTMFRRQKVAILCGSKADLVEVGLDDDCFCHKVGTIHAVQFAFEAFPTTKYSADEIFKRFTLYGITVIAIKGIIALFESSNADSGVGWKNPRSLFACVDDDCTTLRFH